MILKIYAVRDSKVEAWLPPFCARHKGEAIRGLEQAVNSEDHPFAKWPNDHAFFELGEYDDSTGQITSHMQPVPMGLAAEYKKVSENTDYTKILGSKTIR